ncbi:MAG: helix-turn-helix domain-containing protein [Bacillota bacterium]|nr:helix-turn-helix domain-containing protein [Bacillota bacterium]
MDNKSLGLLIKQLRSEYSLKIGKRFFQKDLAETLNVSRGYIGDIENGRTKPNDNLLEKIANFFEVPLDTFKDDNSTGCYINGTKLKQLRNILKLSQKDLSDKLELNDINAIKKIENGNKSITLNMLNKISNLFKVDSNFLYSNNRDAITTCSKCGLSYCPLDEHEYLKHVKYHNSYEEALIKFGDLYGYQEGESIQKDLIKFLKDDSIQFNEKYDKAIQLIRYYFNRSVRNNSYDTRHVNFDEYIPMLLNQDFFKEKLQENIYIALVNKYGTKSGLKEGTADYEIHEETKNNSSQIDTIAAHLEGKNITPKKMRLLEKYIDTLFDEFDED